MSKKASAKGGALSAATATRGGSDFHASFGGSRRPTRDQIVGALDRIFKESGCVACGLIGRIVLDIGDPVQRIEVPNVNIIQQKISG